MVLLVRPAEQEAQVEQVGRVVPEARVRSGLLVARAESGRAAVREVQEVPVGAEALVALGAAVAQEEKDLMGSTATTGSTASMGLSDQQAGRVVRVVAAVLGEPVDRVGLAASGQPDLRVGLAERAARVEQVARVVRGVRAALAALAVLVARVEAAARAVPVVPAQPVRASRPVTTHGRPRPASLVGSSATGRP